MFKRKQSVEKSHPSKARLVISNLKFFSVSRFSIKKQTFFAKRLSFLIKAGLPILESLHVIQKQSKSNSEIQIFNKIIDDISNGQSLANSLTKFEGVFGGFAINIIKAGESSGNLTMNLNYLADELRKKEILKNKILSAMLYPIIITIATFLITGLLIIYIFPKILPIFSSLHTELPLSTRIVIFVSDIFRHYGIHILIGGLLVFMISGLLIKYVKKVQFFYHGFLIKVPFIGGVVKNYNLSNLTRTLGLLLKSDISIGESILIAGDTTENAQYKKALIEISSDVSKGKNLSSCMITYPALFPDMICHLVAVGEKSGSLSNTLIYLSEFYENEFDDLTKNLSSAIEPVLMILMGILVGFIAISVITPIYEITNSLKR